MGQADIKWRTVGSGEVEEDGMTELSLEYAGVGR
jgi:hypothetical protein